MRTLLRRRLQESTADQWQDSDLNDLLNLGLHEIQKRVVAVDPFFLVYIDEADSVGSQDLYKKPVGFWYEFSLEVKDSAAGEYKRIKREDDPEVQLSGNATVQTYSHFGQYFRIKPAPAVNLVDGIRLSYMPTLEMAADSDVPDIHLALHMAAVVAAQMVTMGELGVARDTIQAELESLSNPEIIGRYYHRSAADLDQVKVDLIGPTYTR